MTALMNDGWRRRGGNEEEKSLRSEANGEMRTKESLRREMEMTTEENLYCERWTEDHHRER
ncbi:uncharacterized protein N7498_000418 [Penicillium cinerascens]|uniref:Uncharacterized protein n=1 Tax=Penicillium cinerascens TaxID=70096 RepID=A0A9W9NGI5_9EURO|nr:uncharacterized protein N7498_000418 [Penicillium cinerascens]KAJ5218319.1 hypothetical protein N7498_000418 [Penicillium cinerascens]